MHTCLTALSFSFLTIRLYAGFFLLAVLNSLLSGLVIKVIMDDAGLP